MKKTKRGIYTSILGILLLVCIFCMPVASAYDCCVDRTRVAQGVPSNIADYVNDRMDEAKCSINSLVWVDGVRDDSYSYSPSAFISHINSLTTLSNIVLIHCHGSTSGGSSKLVLYNGDYLTASYVEDNLDEGGLFIFAAACGSSCYSDLGNAFVDKGFDAYLGYRDTVLTDRNAGFYAAFFDKANRPGISVAYAADYASDAVLDEFGDYGGTNGYRIYGDSTTSLLIAG